MIKKTASLIISLFVAMGMLTFTVPAAQYDNDGGSLSFITATGIMKNTETDGNALLTRAELAKMYYNILTQSEIPEDGDGKSKYTDVDASLKAVVDTVAGAGIMNGLSSDYFGSGENVTYIQLLKTMVSFLGYSAQAEYEGGWPMGYYGMAAKLALTNGAPADMNYYVTYNGAAQVFRAAADADIMLQTTFSNGEYVVQKDLNFLEYYMGIKRTTAVVTANSITSLDSNALTQYGNVELEGVLMSVNESAKDIENMLGCRVIAYYSEYDGEYEIKYFDEKNNDITKIDGEDILSANAGYIKYSTQQGKEKSIRINASTIVVYNNTVAKSYSEATINPFEASYTDGQITCVDNNFDGVSDVVFVDAYRSMIVGGVKDDTAYSAIRSGEVIALSDFGDNSVAVKNTLGEPIRWNDITQGDVLSYYCDLNGDVTEIYVTIDTGEGVVEEIEKNGSVISKLTVSGKAYDCAKYLSENPDTGELNPGDFVTMYFNKDAKVCEIEKGTTDGSIALLQDFEKTKGLEGRYRVRLLLASGEFVNLYLAQKINVNGTVIEDSQFLTKAGETAQGRIVRQVIKFEVSEDNELSKILLGDNSKGSDGMYKSEFFIYDGFDASTAVSYRDEMDTFGLRVYVDGSTKVFVIPPEENRDNEKGYAVKTSSTFGDASYKVVAYGTDKYSPCATAMLYESANAASSNLVTSYNYFAIDKISKVLDESGETVLRITGYYRTTGEKSDQNYFDAASESALKVGPGDTLPENGDIIKYSLDASGRIDSAMLVFDKSEDGLYNMNNPSETAYPASSARYAYGKLVYSSKSHITLEIVNTDNSVRYESYPIFRLVSNGVTFEKSGNDTMGHFRKTTKDDFYSKLNYSDDCSKVFIYISGPYWITAAVYND